VNKDKRKTEEKKEKREREPGAAGKPLLRHALGLAHF
jgi:hypothetical protein